MHPTSSSPTPPAVRVARAPTPQDVDAIGAIGDPVVRNLRITHTYHLLSAHFGARTGVGANWCTFAVWASRQAGCTIRGEDLLEQLRGDRRLRALLGRAWRRVFVAALERGDSRRSVIFRILSRGAISRASAAVALGNRKVFEEIAREFARFLPLCEGGRVAPEALAAFLGGLERGPAPGGQDLLRQAFTHYAAALEAEDATARAELLLLANLEIGLHEQTRLQPQILAALEVPFDTVSGIGHRLLDLLHPPASGWNRAVRTPLALALGAVVKGAALSMRALLRHLITERMMTLALPDGVLHLGRDLTGEYPACLREPRSAELRALLERYVPAADDADGAGASDWSVLEQRMQLISRLFRLRHEDAGLLRAPYTPEQVLAFEAGRLPDGEL